MLFVTEGHAPEQACGGHGEGAERSVPEWGAEWEGRHEGSSGHVGPEDAARTLICFLLCEITGF